MEEVVGDGAVGRALGPAGGEELAGGAGVAEEHDAALGEELEAVEAGEDLGGGLVDDAEDGAGAEGGGEALEDARDVVGGGGVEPAGGLVEEEDDGGDDELAADGDAAALAAAHAADEPVADLRVGAVGEAELGEDGLGDLERGGGRGVAAAADAEARGVGEGLADGERADEDLGGRGSGRGRARPGTMMRAGAGYNAWKVRGGAARTIGARTRGGAGESTHLVLRHVR